MKIIRYVVKEDIGLAPNPFHGWCTLAVCTPNHQRAKVDVGDWIVGNSGNADGYKLIYAMRVDRVMDMDEYFHAPEFEVKRPDPYGSEEGQRGDNFYFKDKKTGSWRRLPSMFHNGMQFFYKDLGKDLDGREVFAGQVFYYFGENRIPFPTRFAPLIASGRGVRTLGKRDRDENIDSLYQPFIDWLKNNHELGCMSAPRDMKNTPATGPMVTNIPVRQSGVLQATDNKLKVTNAVAPKSCAPTKKNNQ